MDPAQVRKPGNQAATGESQELGLLLGGKIIRDERNKRKQTARYRSAGSEPFGSSGRKIGAGHEFKSDKLKNAFFHDRPFILTGSAILVTVFYQPENPPPTAYLMCMIEIIKDVHHAHP